MNNLPPLLRQLELAWLAGIVDGEGSIMLVFDIGKYKPRFQIVNTNQLIIETSKKILNNNGVYKVLTRLKNPTRLTEKPCYELVVSNQADLTISLKLIQEYLVGKREQCRLLKEFLSLRSSKMDPSRSPYTSREVQIFEELAKLNRRGV